ncbi:FtsX-like permease family protein [Actinomadura verrucosospora]|uniref:Putative ABC transporter integral membrane protein n=1 Tax=Actinomadura verrucosospora TaxID=46165 RepID=A0A7D3VX44_ACTVE|nr:FtsX-like permease family protein [Actinomadura verrucosospora]QKG25915.1 putative ABC transporter integral membrane protein [Actinomadura verrucosospora]
MSGRGAALRLARRDALRAKGRTALVVCMIGLPVMAVVALAVLFKTGDWSPRESLPYEIGTADARLTGAGRAPVQQTFDDQGFSSPPGASGDEAGRPWTTPEITERVAAAFGPAARVRPLETGGRVALRTARGYRAADHIGLDLRDPMARGILEITGGRAPAKPGEVALAPSLGFPVGASVQIDRAGTTAQVVGHVRDPREPGKAVALTLPGAVPGAPSPRPQWLVAGTGPVTWDAVTALNKSGITVLSRAVVSDPPPRARAASEEGGGPDGAAAATVAMAVAVVVLEVVLLAGPAFAVGVRRQRHRLALVAACGGDARHLRTVVLAGGLVLGGAAAVAGALLGLLVVAAAKPLAKAYFGVVLGPYEVPWTLVALTMLLGAGSGVLAALVPALQAARMDVVAALAGRREAGRARRGWPAAGAVLVLAGIAACLFGTAALHEFGAALGAAAIVLGCVMATPWLVGAAGRGARWLPLPLRLAVRDGARNRGRAAPVVAAIMAAVAGITVFAIGVASDARQERLDYEATLPMGTATISTAPGRADALKAAVERELPGVPVLPLRALPGEGSVCGRADTAECPAVAFAAGPAPARTIRFDNVVGGAREARMLLGRDDPAVTGALAAGKVVVFASRPLPGGTTTATVTYWKDDVQHTLRTVRGIPADAVPGDPHVQTIVPPSVAARVGVPVRTEALGIDRADHRVSRAEQARLAEVAAGFSADGAVYVERGPSRSRPPMLLALAIAGAVLAFGGTMIATGLAAADARPDLATLAAIGARPRTRRALAMGQAGFVAVLGCWLGIAAGFVPGVAVARPLTAVATIPARPDGTPAVPGHGPTLDVPWPILLTVGVAVPLLAVLAAALFTRRGLPLTHRPAD